MRLRMRSLVNLQSSHTEVISLEKVAMKILEFLPELMDAVGCDPYETKRQCS